MIFHISINSEFVSTTVPYQIDLYDENRDYADGSQVRIDDDIYEVNNVYTTIEYPQFQDYKYYNYGDKVQVDGVGYQKVSEYVDRGCWGTLTSATNSIDLDAINFEYWDGVTFNHGINVGSNNAPCESDVTYTFIDNGKVDNYRNVRITKLDNDTLEITEVGIIKLYDEIFPDVDGCFFIRNGKVSKLFGVSKSKLISDGLTSGKWIKLPSNSYEEKTHKLTYLKGSVRKRPFDDKQYSTVNYHGNQTWKIKPLYYCKSVALGHVKADRVIVRFKNYGDALIEEFTFDLLDNAITIPELDAGQPVTISDDGVEPTTVIAYTSSFYPMYYIEIELVGSYTEIGMIMPCLWLDVGATNLEFTNDIKNYDKNFVSEISGYVEHYKGNRVIQHKGSFDIPLSDYDKTVLINKKLTQELIAIDGSDTISNEPSDSINRFSSTKLIGRVKKLITPTKSTNKNSIDDYLKVTFEFEEVV